MITEQQNDILSINQVQLPLAEKRTALAIMRTGIADIKYNNQSLRKLIKS